MAQYIKVQKYSKNGIMAISYKSIEDIVTIVTNDILGVKVKEEPKKSFALLRPVKCLIINDVAKISIEVLICKENNAIEICEIIQKKVSETLLNLIETIKVQTNVKIVGFIE